MKLSFGIELTPQSLNITLFGHHRRFPRGSARRAMAKRIETEGPLAVCLSILYKDQHRVLHYREHGTLPKSRGGGRIAGQGERDLNFPIQKPAVQADAEFTKAFEFGTDPPAKKAKGVGNGSQRDSETGESCYWSPEERARSGGPAPLPLDDGHDEILPLPKPVKEG